MQPGGGAGAALAPPWWQKVLRTFIFTFIGTFVTTIATITQGIADGKAVDYTAAKALLLSAVTGAFAAAIRAVVALLPIFGDDNDIGMQK